MELRELTKDVYVILTKLGDPRGDSNFGLITGNNGAVLIDADIRRWEETRQYIESVTKQPVRYLINTHDNFDHTSANTMLARQGAVIISSKACRSIMVSTGRNDFKEKVVSRCLDLKEKYELAELSLPDLTADGHLFLNLGERTLEISFVGHAHTPGDMVVYLPGDEILFAGDVLFNGCHPVAPNADISNWLKVLDNLMEKSIQLTVPGHGEPAAGKNNLQDLKNYFQVLRSRVGKLKAKGLSLEEVENSIALPEYEDLRKKRWLPMSIKKIYGELV